MGLNMTFMGLNMNVYGVKHERLWGKVRSSLINPIASDAEIKGFGV